MAYKNRMNDLDNKTWLKFQKSWFIHNPPPRKKGVLTHPAKYPETMVQEFIEFFTKAGETVLDPMAGTGSTLVAALRSGRHSYGIELNPKYAGIAQDILTEEKVSLTEAGGDVSVNATIINGDAANAASYEIPQIDYLITSPPYWDMLHARGAMTQKKRRAEDALDVVYSDDPDDVGNIRDYEEFLEKLIGIYAAMKPLLRERAYLTIIVKNVKKKGRIYPLAWDIGRELGKVYTLKDEKIWCLPPGEKIWTLTGLKAIEEIVEGEEVLTHLGTLQKVTKTMRRQHSGKLVKIKSSLIGKTISLTPEHEVLTIERRQYQHNDGKPFWENFKRSESRGSEWKAAEDLKTGDVVAFPIPQTTLDLIELDTSTYMAEVLDWIEDEDWYYTRGQGKQGRGKLPKRIRVDKDFMRLAGWFLAEGSATDSGAYIANQDISVQDEIAKLFKNIFDVNSKADKNGVWCRSRSVSTLLANLFGKGAHEKHLPDFVFHLPHEKQRHLLQAIWAGDGHVSKKRLTYKTVSESLAMGVTYLTTRFGAIPYIQRFKNSFGLNYRGLSQTRMREVLELPTSEKKIVRDQHWLRDYLIWLPIQEIETEDYDGLVYNLEVDVANSYTTENFIVHNCQDNQRLAPYGMGNAWVSNTFHHYCLQFRKEA